MTIPSRLSDGELVAEVARLARAEREATTSLIAHLAELYARRLHEREGFSSLFTYCTDVLRLSEHEAYDRMKAAKVVRRYPGVLGLLASGRVNLTTVRLLAPHLTRSNQEELFTSASGRSKRKVQELLARRFPRPDVASSVRKLPAPSVVSVTGPEPTGATTGVSTSTAVLPPRLAGADDLAHDAPPPQVASTDAAGFVPTQPPPRPRVRPLAPDRYQVTFTAGAQTCEKLELAQDLLRHAIPSGDPAQIFARALDLLVEDLVKRKFAVTDRPRARRGQAEESRNVPAEVKRAVFIRDRGRCAFVGTHGRKCGNRSFVEFHHVSPYAAGGRPTLDNIELRCRAHNSHEAEVFYGPAREYAGSAAAREAAVARERLSHDAFRSGTTAAARGRQMPPRARNGPS